MRLNHNTFVKEVEIYLDLFRSLDRLKLNKPNENQMKTPDLAGTFLFKDSAC